MRFLIIVLLLFSISANAAVVWGKKGHRVTGYIAEKHLSRKAKKAINDLLDGHSLAFVSTFADEIKADRTYSEFYSWHYVNYPLGVNYLDAENIDEMNVVSAVNKCKQVLLDDKASRADKVFYLKMLVHFIGDLHQPLHVGRGEDKGGNDIQVQWFNDGSNIHRVWDTQMIESYGMSFYELGEELLRSTNKRQRKKIQEGTLYNWVDESHVLAEEIYNSVTIGEELKYRYSYTNNPRLFEQLQKGGLRLAKVLNDIFS
ncbi:endonuclease [Croceivirga lutea]|uniref:S1/P1 nuclease n=1 Tax=Croceivirga lutea TaxID=1775167 RepID=UPI00163AB3FA|nr:S1/P1 nuclease [Croceivirga lutea]GGG57469.1 endonuclease [Croceivirga lutea]